MYLKKFRNLNKLLLKFRISKYKMFKADTILNLLSSVSYLVANLLFWYLITDTGFLIDGWSYQDILVYIAFSELFFGLDDAIFSMASRFWRIIHMGILDNYLMRPLDPRSRFILLNINYIGILSSFVSFIVIFSISKIKLDLLYIVFGIVIVILADVVLALIRLSLSYAAFWFGKMDAISEIADCLTWFNKYPLVIMPKMVQLIFETVLPFYFFSTFSAELILNKLDHKHILYGLFGLLLNLVIWSIINNFLWKKGTSRYESIHG